MEKVFSEWMRALLAALDLVIVSHGLVLIALKRAADEAGHSSASGIEQLELVAVRAPTWVLLSILPSARAMSTFT